MSISQPLIPCFANNCKNYLHMLKWEWKSNKCMYPPSSFNPASITSSSENTGGDYFDKEIVIIFWEI